MRTWVAAVLASSLLALPAPGQEVVAVTADTLNVRDAPFGTILGTTSRGTLLVASDERSGFVQVDWGGRKAWVFEDYTAPSAAPAIEVTASALNVRDGPSMAGSIIGTARAGQAFAQLGTSGEWVRIQFAARTAWVHGGHVRTLTAGSGGITPDEPDEPPPPLVGGWQAVHRGLTLDGAQVPRRGLQNRTLLAALGVAVEPHGAQATHGGLPFVRGRVSWFGGPSDTGVTSTETGAISGERLRSLNTPLTPSAAQLAQRPRDFYYAAMRFDYTPRPRSWWAQARLLVVEPVSGRAVVVRCCDWGPNTFTQRVIDLSPQCMRDLGVSTDANVLVAFAPAGTPLGPVR